MINSRKHFIPHTLISVLLSIITLSVSAQSAEELYQQGLKYHTNGQFEKAVECFQKALSPNALQKFTPATGAYAEYLNASYNHLLNGKLELAKSTYNIYVQLAGKTNTYIQDCLDQGGIINTPHAGAEYLLGMCYFRGEGVTQNFITAMELFTKAAKQGDVRAVDLLKKTEKIVCYEDEEAANTTNITVGAAVTADLMNVLYAGFDNPISVSASGISADKVALSMTGGTLISKGAGKYVARPAAVGQNVTFTATGVYQGKMITMGTFTFRVRKLPDPTAYVILGHDRFRGGGLSKGAAIGSSGIGAAIDDGLLDIPFKVLGFEVVLHDRMGNARPELSDSSHFTEAQRNLMREVRPGGRFYITRVKVLGPDGIHRTLPFAIEVIVR